MNYTPADVTMLNKMGIQIGDPYARVPLSTQNLGTALAMINASQHERITITDAPEDTPREIEIGPMQIARMAQYTQTTAFKQMQSRAHEDALEAEDNQRQAMVNRQINDWYHRPIHAGKALLYLMAAFAALVMVVWFCTAGAR